MTSHHANRPAAALAIALAALAAAPASAPATLYIHVGQINLLPDTPNQTAGIWVTTDSADQVGGCNFNAQVAGGGPELGGLDGPDITGVDLTSGTIFAGNHLAQTDLGSLAQLAMYSVVTQDGTVTADGLLASLTFDTTGFSAIGSTWALELSATHNGPTDFAPTGATITDGTIRIVPEPATLLSLTGACLAAGGYLRRRLRIRRRRPE